MQPKNICLCPDPTRYKPDASTTSWLVVSASKPIDEDMQLETWSVQTVDVIPGSGALSCRTVSGMSLEATLLHLRLSPVVQLLMTQSVWARFETQFKKPIVLVSESVEFQRPGTTLAVV